MIYGLNQAKQKINAADAVKSEKYLCPEPDCPNPVLILKHGKVRVPHFAHKGNVICRGEPEHETETHLMSKLYLKQLLSLDNEYIEYTGIKGVRPDVLYKKFAIEIQCSSITQEEIERRNKIYHDNNLIPVWFFLKDKFAHQNDKQTDLFKMNKPVIFYHSILPGKGHVFLIDNDKMVDSVQFVGYLLDTVKNDNYSLIGIQNLDTLEKFHNALTSATDEEEEHEKILQWINTTKFLTQEKEGIHALETEGIRDSEAGIKDIINQIYHITGGTLERFSNYITELVRIGCDHHLPFSHVFQLLTRESLVTFNSSGAIAAIEEENKILWEKEMQEKVKLEKENAFVEWIKSTELLSREIKEVDGSTIDFESQIMEIYQDCVSHFISLDSFKEFIIKLDQIASESKFSLGFIYKKFTSTRKLGEQISDINLEYFTKFIQDFKGSWKEDMEFEEWMKKIELPSLSVDVGSSYAKQECLLDLQSQLGLKNEIFKIFVVTLDTLACEFQKPFNEVVKMYLKKSLMDPSFTLADLGTIYQKERAIDDFREENMIFQNGVKFIPVCGIAKVRCLGFEYILSYNGLHIPKSVGFIEGRYFYCESEWFQKNNKFSQKKLKFTYKNQYKFWNYQ